MNRHLIHLLAAVGALTLASGFGLATAPQALAATPQPAVITKAHMRPAHAAPQIIIPGALLDQGGPVQSAPRVFIDYWDWTSDPSGEQPYLNRFLGSVGGTPWLATVNQYGGGSQFGLLAGTWSDPTAIPANPSDTQIQAEAASAAAHFGTGTSVNVQIVVATPTGHSTPGFGQWCAYHGAVASMPNVTYTDLPYNTDTGTCGEDKVNSSGLLDGVSIVEGHELAETITDPLINAWIDAGGNEIGDKCAWYELGNITTSAGTFAMQPLWSNAANSCVLPTQTAPSNNNVDFNGDKRTDLALAGGTGSNGVPVALSNGNATFNIVNAASPLFASWATGPGVHIITGDFTGNGRTDIALIGATGWTSIPMALSNGDGTFTITNNSSPLFASWAAGPGVHIITGDFTGNGRTDIALIGVAGWTSIPMALSNGDGTFTITNNSSPLFASWASQPGAQFL